MGKKVYRGFLYLILISFFYSGCKSLNQPKDIFTPLNYTDEDVVNNEIKQIKDLQNEESVKALWRSLLLERKDLIEECSEIVYAKFCEALTDGDYLEARRFFISLNSIDWSFTNEEKNKINELCYTDIPGINSNSQKNPASIKDCLNATATIWVDRGIKVKNGSGFADIVIGSGFFIDERGYLITNHHVIESMVDPKYEGFSRLYIKLLSDPDTKIPAKVIGFDSVLDLALLKVEITPECVLSLGESKNLNVGDKVSAIGTPIGLEGTLTSGIISSVDRKLLSLGNVFQVDAAINSGNSGGPLIDKDLNVQAIVFAGMLRFQGLNFAIPVEYLKQELPLLYKNTTNGGIEHAWLGCYGHTKINGKKKAGLEIQYIMPGGIASMTKMKVGDVIVEIDGKKISSIDDFHYLMMGYQCETLLKCKYLNSESEEKSCFIYLEARPENPLCKIYTSDYVYNSFIPIYGMKLIPASTLNKNSYRIESIIKGSIADQMSFSENDLITVRDVKFDDENKYFYTSITTQNRSRSYLDFSMTLTSNYDSPYYF